MVIDITLGRFVITNYSENQVIVNLGHQHELNFYGLNFDGASMVECQACLKLKIGYVFRIDLNRDESLHFQHEIREDKFNASRVIAFAHQFYWLR